MFNKIFINLIIAGLILISVSGCMFIGMGKQMVEMHSDPLVIGLPVQYENSIDDIIAEVLREFSNPEIEINTIAVLDIRSGTDKLDSELVRQKLITGLVQLDKITIVSRTRLDELLVEQGLGQSGAITIQTIVEAGQLIGVDGFIDGYLAEESSHLILNLNLIKSDSGIIIWSKSYQIEKI
ncbi:MAG: hypothetical protein H8E14_16755 [Candidatus Marinimicrobia bacterium]|nr:hypothetical protein [Candidatus Neomarinimicrobiota bacterium]